ncbi:LemA family protein [Mycoplasmopsis verecunda]|uniref:LemA protein n=1 Tax=Mycoplasmopsis verecunda TaxID=171291 RepID=A0A1T4LBQ8_9BACT|nr:LemA family protein [Mycoplasmopsis verecunda]WPB54814.1 LemA family protein [Mycoplasmopsis verecunda]SJZ52262.1 LemA protein [Mycoplasmopsis verecunda]
MANLFNNSEIKNPQGLEPVADNTPVKATASTGAKVMVYLSFLLIVPIFLYIIKRNNFLRTQNEINEKASLIDVQLQKRSDTLTKLVAQVKSYKIHEEKVFEDVARLRALTLSGNTAANSNEIESLNNSIFGRLMAVGENYPELKADSMYMNLMDETAYIEREIASARRLYNSTVNAFNMSIMTFPANVVAENMGLSTASLFQASTKARLDVDMNELGL